MRCCMFVRTDNEVELLLNVVWQYKVMKAQENITKTGLYCYFQHKAAMSMHKDGLYANITRFSYT